MRKALQLEMISLQWSLQHVWHVWNSKGIENMPRTLVLDLPVVDLLNHTHVLQGGAIQYSPCFANFRTWTVECFFLTRRHRKNRFAQATCSKRTPWSEAMNPKEHRRLNAESYFTWVFKGQNFERKTEIALGYEIIWECVKKHKPQTLKIEPNMKVSFHPFLVRTSN